jgi:hypothetical protein
MKGTGWPVTMLLVALATVGPIAAQEEVLLNDLSGGVLPIENESTIRVVGVAGTIALRTARDGQLIYESRSLDNRREERAVALWLRGRVLELRPLDGASQERLLIELAVPPGLATVLDLVDSRVQIAGLRSDLVIRGAGLDIDARGIYGTVDAVVDESVLKIDGTDDDVNVDGGSLELTLKRVGGYATLSLADSQASVETVQGAADVDLENSVLVAAKLEGGIRLSARGGKVELAEVKRETDLRLEEAPLVLSDVIGRATIESDSDVQFDRLRANMTITSFGGRIRGSGNTEPTVVATDRSEVILDQLQGKLALSGDGLTIVLREIKGDATVQVTSSSVMIEKASGVLDIQTDFGDVRVQEASNALKVISRDGDVMITDLSGPLELHASGNQVEVAWTEIAKEQNQVIENDSGDVTLRFPAGSACRVEAESSFGRVRSDLPTVRVSDDERFASGTLGNSNRPMIQVKSAGDVHITAGKPNPER